MDETIVPRPEPEKMNAMEAMKIEDMKNRGKRRESSNDAHQH